MSNRLPEVWQANDGTVVVLERWDTGLAGELFKIVHIGPVATEINMWRGQMFTKEFLENLAPITFHRLIHPSEDVS